MNNKLIGFKKKLTALEKKKDNFLVSKPLSSCKYNPENRYRGKKKRRKAEKQKTMPDIEPMRIFFARR